jgi:hypothetical protein
MTKMKTNQSLGEIAITLHFTSKRLTLPLAILMSHLAPSIKNGDQGGY